MCITLIVWFCLRKKRFRLHHEEEEPKKKSQLRNRGQINRMFSDKVESQQAKGLNQHNGNDYNEIG